MKARKIVLTDYEVRAPGTPASGDGQEQMVPYFVRTMMAMLLTHPQQNLNATQIVTNAKLARRIQDCEEDELLLGAEEYGQLQQAINSARGYGGGDVEMIERVLEAPEVEVEEKPPGTGVDTPDTKLHSVPPKREN